MMNKFFPACFMLLSLVYADIVFSDQIQQQSGWASWFNSQKLNENWGYVSDIQVRSSDDWEDVQTLLVRPGITYFLDDRNSFTFGYAWVGTLNNPDENLVEHRIWQQYIHTSTLSKIAFTHRFRLEQRFTERPQAEDRLFSQRLRYFLRAVVPLSGDQPTFQSGPFVALQNELFFNIQHKDNANGELFDQNRLLLAGGYRLSSRVDLELGYLNQFIRGASGNDTMNHVVQFAIYTRF